MEHRGAVVALEASSKGQVVLFDQRNHPWHVKAEWTRAYATLEKQVQPSTTAPTDGTTTNNRNSPEDKQQASEFESPLHEAVVQTVRRTPFDRMTRVLARVIHQYGWLHRRKMWVRPLPASFWSRISVWSLL